MEVQNQRRRSGNSLDICIWLTAAIVLLLVPAHVLAQTSVSGDSVESASEVQTLIPAGKIESGGFGALVVKVGPVNNNVGVFWGARGGWVINRTFVLGGGGYGFTDAMYTGKATVDTNIAFGYGGLELEYLIHSNNLLHATIVTLIGAGGFTVFRRYGSSSEEHYGTTLYSAGCFVAEPAVNIELNVLSWMRLQLGVGYRFATGIDATIGATHYGNSTVSGVFGVGAIKFGPY